MFRDQVTTDGHTSYPRAIRETMSSNVQHRTNTYLNNRLEPGPSRDQATLLSDAWIWKRAIQQPASVVSLMNCGTFSVPAIPWMNQSHFQNNGKLSSDDLSP
jgi:hypothetical protein